MKELMEMIGHQGYIVVNGWTVPVQIQDVKKVYGTEKLLARGVNNCEQWINRDSFHEILEKVNVSVQVVR